MSGSLRDHGSGLVEGGMPCEVAIAVEIVAISLLQRAFFHQQHIIQRRALDGTHNELLLVNVAIFPWFTSFLSPIHKAVGPLYCCQLVGAEAKAAAVRVWRDWFVFTQLTELIRRSGDEQSEVFWNILHLTWRDLCERAGGDTLHITRLDSPGKESKAG